MITKATVRVRMPESREFQVLREVLPDDPDANGDIERYVHTLASEWLDKHYPGNWRYVGQYQTIDGIAGDLVPAMVDTVDAERDARYAAETARRQERRAHGDAERQRALQADPLYPAVQAAWALYAASRRYDPAMPVRYEEHIDRLECDGIALGRDLKDTLDFLNRSNSKASGAIDRDTAIRQASQ